VAFVLTEEEQGLLTRTARDAITTYLKKGVTIPRPKDTPDKLLQKCGVFVTLHNISGGRELRGCIGFPRPTLPLIDATIDAAISAAVRDPRFPPVTLSEMKEIVIEISVLTPPQLIKVRDPREYPSRIRIGRDGLMIQKGPYSGLLLPQVATEEGWDPEEFLCHCCLKAWLPPDEWLSSDTRVYRFQAIIFEEEAPGGRAREKGAPSSVTP